MYLLITPNNPLPVSYFSMPVAPGFSILMIFLSNRKMLSPEVRITTQLTGKMRFRPGLVVFMSLVQIKKKREREKKENVSLSWNNSLNFQGMLRLYWQHKGDVGIALGCYTDYHSESVSRSVMCDSLRPHGL